MLKAGIPILVVSGLLLAIGFIFAGRYDLSILVFFGSWILALVIDKLCND